jgi:hypothetical protein
MSKKLIVTSLFILSCVSSAHAQNTGSFYTQPYDSATSDEYYGYGDRFEHERSDEYYRARTRARVARERAKVIHEDENAERDRIYTRVYNSNVERQDNRNSLDTVSQATNTIAQIAGTAKFIQNLFGN